MKVKDVVVDMHQGINTVADKVEYLEKGIPIIQSKNFTKGFLDLEDVRFLGKEDEEKYIEKYNPHIGDILMANIGTIGKSFVISEEQRFLIAWNAFLIKPNHEKVQSDFLKFYFDYLADNHFFDKLLTGGTVKFINKTKIGDIILPDKSLNEQSEICNRLSKIEQIIIKRQRQLELLDCFIKARFVELFGDPCSNPMGHTKMTIKEAIDAGYIEKPLDGNHGEKHPKASEYVDDGVPFVMANNLANGVVDYESCSKITRERADKLDKGFSHDGDVLITHKGTIGRTAIVHTELDYIMLTPQVTYYRPLNGIVAEYLKGYFDTDFFQGEMKKLAAAGGSTRAYVGITNQTQLQLLIPSQGLQTQFAEVVKQVDKSKVA